MTSVATGGQVRSIRPGEVIGARRAEPVVVIPVYGAPELFRQCLDSVLRHTPADVPILIADDASPGPEIRQILAETGRRPGLEHRLFVLNQAENVGFVENVNDSFDAVAPGDTIVLNSDCIVGPEWVARLRAAAYSDSNVATATALTNHGTILSIPTRNKPRSSLPRGTDVAALAVDVARRSERLRPRIPTAIGHCFYVRRAALDLVGSFDPAFSPGYGEEVDFSQRCVLRGLSHVAADDVFVYHAGRGSFGQNELQLEHERVLLERYPYYHLAVAEAADAETNQLGRALATASRVLLGEIVTIDGRCLGPTVTGTQVHVLELTAALWRSRRVRLRVVVPPDVGDWALRTLESLSGVDILRSDELTDETPRTAIAHRPYQIFHLNDLPALSRLGERVVITHQDLIAYRNPDYSRSPQDWVELHRLTRLTLGFADLVLFFSEHARQDALAEGLVDPSRACVVQLGVDHRAFRPESGSVPPSKFSVAEDEEFLLCLGTNFRHKNRIFALELLQELQNRHAWHGWLVFAGPHAASGTSEVEEAEFLAAHPTVADRTIDVEGVDETEKHWLLAHAAGLVYPSVYEGFGLVPFEAAALGTPSFFAWQTALAETLPPSAATLVAWDAAVSSDEVASVLASRKTRRALAHAISAAGMRLRWDRTALEVIEAYEAMLGQPRRELVTALEGTAAVWDLTPRGDEALVRLGVPLEPYRALLAILGRPRLRRAFYFCLSLSFRLGYLARHGRLPTL